MPSIAHEVPIELFRERPELVPQLLADLFGVELPPHRETRIEESGFTETVPTTRFADLVLTLRDGAANRTKMGIVVEVQRAIDTDKRWSWPLYLAALHARIRAPVCLLVVTFDHAVHAWASQPITSLLGMTFAPFVVGPKQIPWLDNEEAARTQPELAVLSALAHAEEPGGIAVAMAAFAAAASLDSERKTHYHDLLYATFSAALRREVELLMETRKYEYKSDFAKTYFGQGMAEGEAKGKAEGKAEGKVEGKVEGKAEGKAEALLAVLAARGITISEPSRQRVLDERNLATLDRWVARAVRITAIDELFVE